MCGRTRMAMAPAAVVQTAQQIAQVRAAPQRQQKAGAGHAPARAAAAAGSKSAASRSAGRGDDAGDDGARDPQSPPDADCMAILPVSWTEDDREAYAPRENVYPGRYTPVLVQKKLSGDGADAGGDILQVECKRWGLVPFFAPKSDSVNIFTTMNARSETARETRMWRHLVGRNRCVVLVQGFYEWTEPTPAQKQRGETKKQPFYVHRADGKPLFLAGLHDCWTGRKRSKSKTNTSKASSSSGAAHQDAGAEEASGEENEEENEEGDGEELEEMGEDAEGAGTAEDASAAAHGAEEVERDARGWVVYGPAHPLATYTILTCDSSRALGWLHTRMPCILQDEAACRAWLDPERTADDAWSLLRPLGDDIKAPARMEDRRAGALQWHPVTRQMSSVRYEAPDVAEPVALPKALPSITGFFGKASATKAGKEAAAPAPAPAPAPAASPPPKKPAASPVRRSPAAKSSPAKRARKDPPPGNMSITSFFGGGSAGKK